MAACSGERNPGTASPGGNAAIGLVEVRVDTETADGPISPLIRGISGDWSTTQMSEAGIRLGSWGGNPSSRYNYLIGNAWNTARDYEFRNTDYGHEGDVVRRFVAENEEAGAETRLAVPTIGWVARDTELDTCSFPDGEGGCATPDVECDKDGPIADPLATSVESTPTMVAEWVRSLVDDGVDVRFIAMDNEPELWGLTHYDVHPECTTAEEVLDSYLRYATAVRSVVPDAELLGPVICCWFDFWDPARAPDGGFLSWFLDEVRAADEATGVRTLDVLDVHYYPQSNVFNDAADAETNARRLRSTRSLWDPTYVDESWINERIALLPHLHETIAATYPDLRLAISEWNFGADATMNGAVAIADVLGIYGREGVYAAAYWRSPAHLSPGFFAFAMHGNYDGQGTAFEGTSVEVQSTNVELLAAFAALDERAGALRLMLINKHPSAALSVDLAVDGRELAPSGRRYSYGDADPTRIVADTVTLAGRPLVVPPYTIVVLDLAVR